MKKALAVLLAVVLTVGFSMTAAAATAKITNISSGAMVDKSGNVFSLEDHEFQPGDQFKIYFDKNSFSISNDTTDTVISKTLLDNAKVSVRIAKTKGSEYIKTVEIKTETDSSKNRIAYISVEMVDTFNSITAKDIDFKIQLYLDKSRKDEVRLMGQMENPVEYVEEGQDYVSLEGGVVLEALAYIPKIEIDLGDGVIIETRLYTNRKYFGSCTVGITEEDEKVIDRYPEIIEIYRLNTINLNGSGNIVTLMTDTTMYVYNKEGKYIGTTDSKLPYSDMYYVAEKKIAMTGSGSTSSSNAHEEEEEAVAETPVSTPPPANSGSSSSSTSNQNNNNNYVNDNPGTGAAGFVSVAVLAGLAALAVIQVTGKKH